MRIGQYLYHYPAPGGSTSVLRGLSAGLAALGHRSVVYGYGEGVVPELPGTRTCLFPAPRLRTRPLGELPLEDEFTRRLAANDDRLDLLVIHGMFGTFSRWILRAARRSGIRCIAMPHDPYSPAVFATRRRRKEAYWRLFERPYLRSVDAIQLYAPSHAVQLSRLGVAVPAFAVPAGVDRAMLDRGAPLRRMAAVRSGQKAELLYLGRFDVHNKGLDILLDALAGDDTLRSRVKLRCVGARTEAERREVARLVQRLGLADIVSLAFRTPDPWMEFARADALVLPSRFDGFALVVLEALAAGRPAVVSTEAGAAEYVGREHGVAKTRPEQGALAVALRMALDDLTSLRQAAQRSHELLVRDLTWSSSARAWARQVTELGLVEGFAPSTSSAVTAQGVGRT